MTRFGFFSYVNPLLASEAKKYDRGDTKKIYENVGKMKVVSTISALRCKKNYRLAPDIV